MTKYYVKTDRGSEFWYKDPQLKIRHRVFGPSSSWNGMIWWRQFGKLHRENGPAMIWPNGSVAYWLHDTYYEKDEYEQILCESREK